MSFREMGLVMNYAPAHWTPAVRLVALLIADGIMDEHGTCTAPVDWLAERTGQSEAQVKAQCYQLYEEGVIMPHPTNDDPDYVIWTWLVVPT